MSKETTCFMSNNDQDLLAIVKNTDYSYLAWMGIESPINYNSCPLTCNALTLNYAWTLTKSEKI